MYLACWHPPARMSLLHVYVSPFAVCLFADSRVHTCQAGASWIFGSYPGFFYQLSMSLPLGCVLIRRFWNDNHPNIGIAYSISRINVYVWTSSWRRIGWKGFFTSSGDLEWWFSFGEGMWKFVLRVYQQPWMQALAILIALQDRSNVLFLRLWIVCHSASGIAQSKAPLVIWRNSELQNTSGHNIRLLWHVHS